MAVLTEQVDSAIPQKPDYPKWAAEDVWTLWQGACLLLDAEPQEEEGAFAAAFADRVNDLVHIMGATVGTELFLQILNEAGMRFLPPDVVAWAEGKSIPVPEALHSAVLNAHPSAFTTGVLLRRIEELKQRLAETQAKLDAQLPRSADGDNAEGEQRKDALASGAFLDEV